MRRAAPWAVAGAGVLAVLAGVVVFWRANTSAPAAGGWAAYSPLEPGPAYQSSLEVTFDGGDPGRWAVLWTAGHAVGVALLVAGLLVLTGLGGWLLARRGPRTGR